MKKLIFPLFILFFWLKMGAQYPSVAYNYYEADKLLKMAIDRLNDQPKRYAINGVGKEYVSGHFDVPFKLDTGSLKVNFSTDQMFQYKADFELLYNGTQYTSKCIFYKDSCNFLDYGDTTMLKQDIGGHSMAYFYSPYNLIQSIEKNKPSIHIVNTKDKLHKVLGFNDRYGNKFYAYFSVGSKAFTRLLKPVYDEVLGDYYEELTYEHYKNFDGCYFPSRIVHKKGQLAYRDILVTSAQSEAGAKHAEKAGLDISIDTIGANLFLLKLPTLNNKMLVSKNSNYLSVFEAPVSLSVCREVIGFLKEKFPSYPIKYCFLSHHHPDHAGGAAAFMELGTCKIVTTHGNNAYFMTLFRAKHTMKPRQQRAIMPAAPAIDKIAGNAFKRYNDSQCPVEVYEAGHTTQHTKEYLFFYFPGERVLFAADLVFFYRSGIYPQGERAFSVYKLISEKKLAVDRIYTSWPLHGFKDYGTLDELKACLKVK